MSYYNVTKSLRDDKNKTGIVTDESTCTLNLHRHFLSWGSKHMGGSDDQGPFTISMAKLSGVCQPLFEVWWRRRQQKAAMDSGARHLSTIFDVHKKALTTNYVLLCKTCEKKRDRQAELHKETNTFGYVDLERHFRMDRPSSFLVDLCCLGQGCVHTVVFRSLFRRVSWHVRSPPG